LIKEATALEGFIGSFSRDKEIPVGFSWGYRIPLSRTQSVNFPLVRSLLEKKEINPGSTFYNAETGVIEKYQGKGIGSLLVLDMVFEAARKSYKFFTFRTINPQMKKIVTNLFSKNQPTKLFQDPENKSPWFCWDFKDFDYLNAKHKIKREK